MIKSEPVTLGIRVNITATATIATIGWSKGSPPSTLTLPAGTTKEQATKHILDILHSSATSAAGAATAKP
jgi:hypothetical protein